eukprot:6291056-Amphidinium_carterae.1
MEERVADMFCDPIGSHLCWGRSLCCLEANAPAWHRRNGGEVTVACCAAHLQTRDGPLRCPISLKLNLLS